MRVKLNKSEQKKFMQKILKCSSQRKLAKELGVSRRCIRHWLNGRNFIPLEFFEILCKKYNLKIDYNDEDILPENWGQKKGGKKLISSIKDLGTYMKNLHEKNRKRAKKVRHIKNFNIISKFSQDVQKLSLNPLIFIAVVLLTDGYAYKSKTCYEIGYASKSEKLTRIFIEMVKLWNQEIIISEYIKKSEVVCDYFHLPLKNILLDFSYSYKKSPSREQRKDDYLKEPQPSLKFLKNANENYKILCSRFALTAEGGLATSVIRKNNKIMLRARLLLSCAHPILCDEWQTIFKEIGLSFNKTKGKTWSGVSGLYTGSLKNIKHFYDMGGFIEGVKVSDKSERFSGIEKNALLKLCIENKEFNNLKEMLEYLKSL